MKSIALIFIYFDIINFIKIYNIEICEDVALAKGWYASHGPPGEPDRAGPSRGRAISGQCNTAVRA